MVCTFLLHSPNAWPENDDMLVYEKRNGVVGTLRGRSLVHKW